MNSLKIVFAGTPEFAAIILEAILKTNHQVVAVFTQPDRPSGRGLKVLPSLVKQQAILHKIPVFQPSSLKLDGKYPDGALLAKHQFEELDFDLMIVAAYGLLLPKWLLDIAQEKNYLGCINVHASLLPRWRGAAPIHRAIWSGDQMTGTTIMKMAEGLDTGPMIAMETIPIQSLDTTGTLHDRLAVQGARILIEVLNKVANGINMKTMPQPANGVIYAEKVKKDEAKIHWDMDAIWIDRQIRALNPSPGASTTLDEVVIKVWLSENISQLWKDSPSHQPGTVLNIDDLGICVSGKSGVVRLLEVQKAGAKRMTASQFAKSVQLKIGDVFV